MHTPQLLPAHFWYRMDIFSQYPPQTFRQQEGQSYVPGTTLPKVPKGGAVHGVAQYAAQSPGKLAIPKGPWAFATELTAPRAKRVAEIHRIHCIGLAPFLCHTPRGCAPSTHAGFGWP